MRLTFTVVDGYFGDKLDKLFKRKECVREVNPGKVLLPSKFQDIADEILDLTVREDDIWVISYPRTGSTWAQEMVWLIGTDLDFENAATTMQQTRSPLLELTAIIDADYKEWSKKIGNSVSVVDTLPSTRYIKTHLPLQLLPTQLEVVNPKIVYIARNPKDMCVSYYHYCMLVHGLQGAFEDFCELFLNDKAPFGPIWNHILGFWRKRNDPNVLFLKYEDMKRNLRGVILQTSEFLQKQISEKDIQILIEHLSFNKMQKNPAVNMEPIIKGSNGEDFFEKNDVPRFIRKGVVGDWKNFMTPEMSERFDAWTEMNLRGTGLTFD